MYEMGSKCWIVEQRVIPSKNDYKEIEDHDLREMIQFTFESVQKKNTSRELMKLVREWNQCAWRCM